MVKKAGKRTSKEIKDLLEASYQDKPPENIDGFILDKELSTKTAKVYYNPTTGEANVVHRGTQGLTDWGNNLAYAVGAYELTNRYKQGKKVQDKAEKKYGKKNITTLGHSQGSVLARKLGKDTKEIINVNPAYTFEKPAKNEYNIRSSSDVVSSLYAPVAKTRKVLYPNYSKAHDITIPSKSMIDVLGEHSYDILDRLDKDKEIGVDAGKKISNDNIMKAGKRYSRLGYNGEDIDWTGGSVGTPYINQGVNPYGVRGGTKYAQRLARRTRNTFKPVTKVVNKVGSELQSGFNKMGQTLGSVTNDYLLPAVVSAGKPIYDATAMGASTMLTGNPILGKAVADTMWNEMVAKKGYDPRQRQKSQLLGEVSGDVGKAVAKPFSGAIFGAGENRMIGGQELTVTDPVVLAVLSALGTGGLYYLYNTLFRGNRNAVAPIHHHQVQPHQIQHQILPLGQGQQFEEGKAENPYSDISDSDISDDEEEARPAEETKEGSGRKKRIDFSKMKWGSFTRMFQEFKRENPRARVKDLEAFAKRIIKNKKKFSPKAFKKANFYLSVLKKGGASTEQIGMASAMRTYTPHGSPEFYLLSDIVHSADKNDPENSLFRDQSLSKDPNVKDILYAMYPTFNHELFNDILNDTSMDLRDQQQILRKILKDYPNADKSIADDKVISSKFGLWGRNDPQIQAYIHAVSRKPARRARGSRP